MDKILLKSQDDYFLHNNKQIPKQNYRSLVLTSADISEDRTLELSVSSNLPYNRYWYIEELDHNEAAVDLSRFNDSANVLYNHNRDDYIGVIEKAWLKDGKLRNIIRFDTHELAEKILKSVRAGIIRNVSIGYTVEELVLVKSTEEINTYRATKWTPLETSLVTVPADASVGVGRNFYEGRRQEAEGAKCTPACDSDLKSESVRGRSWEYSEKKLEDKVRDSIVIPSALCPLPSALKNEETIMTVETPNESWLKNERERAQSLLAAGKKHNCPELAEKAIAEGWDIFKLRSEILENQKEISYDPIAKVSTPVDLDNKESKSYSLLKSVGYLAGKVSAKEAGLELKVSDHIQETKMNGKPPEGLYYDSARLMSRGIITRAPLQTGNSAAAGDLITTNLLANRMLDFLYNNSAFMPLGVTTLSDLTGNIKIPRTISAPKAYWVEETQTIPEDGLTFDTIGLDPKKIAVTSSCTYEMIQQAESIDLEQLMRMSLITGIALELDRTIGFGSGIGEQPLGIASTPGVNSFSLGTNGGALDYAALVQMQELIDAANAMSGTFGYVMNARTKGKLMRTLDQNTGGGSWIWQAGQNNEGMVVGHRALCSNQIPNNFVKGTASNLTSIIFGNFSQVILGFWSVLDILADPYTQAKQAIINIIAKQLCDLEITRGSYFTVLTDVQNN